MPRLFAFAALGALALAAPAAHAQILYLGYDSSTGSFANPGAGALSAAGTTASGAYTFVNSDSTTTAYSDWRLYNSSQATISGGSTDSLHAGDSSSALVSGGTVTNVYSGVVGGGSSLVTLSGGSFTFLETLGGGVINILGSNLAESKTKTTINGADYYAVTGTLQSGATPFTADYAVSNDSGTLEFNGKVASPPAIPEASSVVSFGLLMALGGVWLAVRRRSAARAAS